MNRCRSQVSSLLNVKTYMCTFEYIIQYCSTITTSITMTHFFYPFTLWCGIDNLHFSTALNNCISPKLSYMPWILSIEVLISWRTFWIACAVSTHGSLQEGGWAFLLVTERCEDQDGVAYMWRHCIATSHHEVTFQLWRREGAPSRLQTDGISKNWTLA